MFFQKIQISFKIGIYSFFSVLKISPGGQNQVLLAGENIVLPGVKIECIHIKLVFVWMHSIFTPGALCFDPRQHSILTPSSN